MRRHAVGRAVGAAQQAEDVADLLAVVLGLGVGRQQQLLLHREPGRGEQLLEGEPGRQQQAVGRPTKRCPSWTAPEPIRIVEVAAAVSASSTAGEVPATPGFRWCSANQ
jgi:hypothetical protein